MSSTRQQPRLTTQQAAKASQRRAMNDRRQKRIQLIRKQKKSAWLAQKRGMSAHQLSSAQESADLSQAIDTFRQQQPTADTLHQLLGVLKSFSWSTTSTTWNLDDDARLEQAKSLALLLGESIQNFWTKNDLNGLSSALQVLVQLVSVSASGSKWMECDYYGRRPPTWSELIAEETRILPSIPSLISMAQHAGEGDKLQIYEQICWFIGNLTQDLPACASTLRQQNGNLTPLLVEVMSLIRHDETTKNPQRLVIVQAATWAFANMLKSDVAASGWVYFQPGWNELFSHLLTLSDPVSTSSLPLDTVCIDITVQTAWILVHLSQREDAVMEALLEPCINRSGSSIDLVRDVSECLFQVCQVAGKQVSGPPTSPGSLNYCHHPLLEPCLEVLGHWAIGCNGRFVARLLSPTPATARVSRELALLPILLDLFKWGHQGLLQVEDYLQLMWLSGCLLCDAGSQNHPSTSVAAPVLIPSLTFALHEHEGAATNRVNSFECKREAVLALWNAISSPPIDNDQSMPTRDAYLFVLQLVLSASAGNETSTNNQGYTTMMALTKLLSAPDADTMLASLRILDAILRNMPHARVTFLEVDGEEALEAVCDLPLGNDNTSNTAAEIAAELIDDVIGEGDQFDDPIIKPATAGGTFVFGLQGAASAPAPIFLPDLQSDGIIDRSTRNPIAVGVPLLGAAGRGRGRGRGETLPAWAVQQQSQR